MAHVSDESPQLGMGQRLRCSIGAAVDWPGKAFASLGACAFAHEAGYVALAISIAWTVALAGTFAGALWALRLVRPTAFARSVAFR